MRKLFAVVGILTSTILVGCSAGLTEEEKIQEEALDELVEILEADSDVYDTFTPISKHYDCVILQLDDFGKELSPESTDCIDWLYSFGPAVERLERGLASLPELENEAAETIKTKALADAKTYRSTPICSNTAEWEDLKLVGEPCSDLFTTKGGAVASIVNDRSQLWYEFIAERQK